MVARHRIRTEDPERRSEEQVCFFCSCHLISFMLCVFDTEQECNTAARCRIRTEYPERRSEEQVCLLELCLLI